MHYITINKFSSVPLYAQLKESIKKAIDDGILKDKDKLPTEEELCNTFNVSRPVVRQAYADLIAQGAIVRMKGKGTFVIKNFIRRNFFNELSNFTGEMERKGIVPRTKILNVEIITSEPRIFPLLELKEGSPCLHFKRIRYGDDIPIYLEDTYISLLMFPGLEKYDFAVNSLYSVFDRDYHLPVAKAYNTFNAQVVSDIDAVLLEVKKKSAVHRVQTFTYDAENKLMEYSIASFPGDRNQFDIVIRRDKD